MDTSRISSVSQREQSVDENRGDELTSPEENRRRRKLVLNRIRGEPFGFELQTYGIHHRGSPELELCTYVSRVYDDSPAFYCGLTPGDVILSVNGSVVAHADHQIVVKLIRQAGNKLSLIVLFENCIKKVELEVKLLQIKTKEGREIRETNKVGVALCSPDIQRLLFKKELELRALVMKEKQILEGVTETDKGRWSDATSTGSSTRSDRSLHYSAESREVLDSFTQISLHDSDHDNIQPSSLPPNQPKVVHLAQHKCEDASSLRHRRYKRHHSDNRPLVYSTGTHQSRMTSLVDPNCKGFNDRMTLHHDPSSQPRKKEIHSTQKPAFRRSQSASGHIMNIRETKIGSTSLGFASKRREPLPVSFRKTSLPTPNVPTTKTLFQNSHRSYDWMTHTKAGDFTTTRAFPHSKSCSSISTSSTTRHMHLDSATSTWSSVTKDLHPRLPRWSSMEKLPDFSVDQPSIDSLEMSGNFSLSMVPGLESPSDEISSL